MLVEDNEDDVFLTREAFEAASPDLILLDMHMPVMNGYEVLTEIIKDDTLRHLPVVVLTSSHEAADIQKMYGFRCSSCITKPVDFDNFVKAIGQLAGYWLTEVPERQ